MKDSESASDESVEQPTTHQSELVTCRHCDRRGLPERIAAHECRPDIERTHVHLVDSPHESTQNNLSSLEYLTIEWTPTGGQSHELTFEHTESGWQRSEAIRTDSSWKTTTVEPTARPTLELTTEAHSHE